MKAALLTLLLACLPLLIGYYLNATAPHPATTAYRAAYCTRYCTLHGCRHATLANSPAYCWLRPVYAATVRALKESGNYQLATVSCLFRACCCGSPMECCATPGAFGS